MDDAQLRHYEAKLAFEIDSWDLAVACERGERVVVVDARSPEAWRREHIPGAISLPHRTIDAHTTRALDRDALVVAYCDGIGCNASTKGALALARLGFRTKELIGGLDWCTANGIHIASMSLGAETAPTAVQTMCDLAFNRGVLLVAAAGNSGGPVSAPGRYGSVIAVSAIESVGRDQLEAARVFGLSRWQILRRIIAPQAAAFAIGPLTGLLVNQLQVTSLISVIGVMDLTKVGNILNLRTLKPFVVWTVVGALYYLTAKLVAYAGGRFEKQLRAHTKWKGL